MERNLRKGAGYSIEAVLAALILFTFAFGAVESPEGKDWSEFQDQVSARDLTFMVKKSGDMNTYLGNSNPGGIRSQISGISSRDLDVSGTVRNLPLNEIEVGVHRMPSKIHINNTEPVQSGDRCEGNLVSLESNSEYEIRRTDSEYLENKHGTRLYFADTDSQQPGGYNGERDYDSIWVDNGTSCVFEEEDGPYGIDEIFLWGNTSDSDSLHYEFKNFDNTTGRFTVYEAPTAKKISSSMNRQLNGIETDTVLNTVNFSDNSLGTYDVLVFQENETLPRIESNIGQMRALASNTSMLFMMNLTQSDLENDFLEDVGFKWTPMQTPSSNEYKATFSDYETSEDIETYFLGLGGSQSQLTLKPGGNVISNQESTETSRKDVLFARNIQYNADSIDGTILGGWTAYSGPSSCVSDRESDFEVPEENYSPETFSVKNVDITDSCINSRRGLILDNDEDGELEGPYLSDEILIINGRRYSPNITSNTEAVLEFAGSKKVELINHRRTLQNISGERVARLAYEEEYNKDDIKMISSTIYWLRGDNIQFGSSEQSSSVSTTVIGGIKEEVFMPYNAELRWVR